MSNEKNYFDALRMVVKDGRTMEIPGLATMSWNDDDSEYKVRIDYVTGETFKIRLPGWATDGWTEKKERIDTCTEAEAIAALLAGEEVVTREWEGYAWERVHVVLMSGTLGLSYSRGHEDSKLVPTILTRQWRIVE